MPEEDIITFSNVPLTTSFKTTSLQFSFSKFTKRKLWCDNGKT